MTKANSNKLITLLLFSFLFLFQACTKDDNSLPVPSEYKYLTGVTTERRFTKAEVIQVFNSLSPGLDIGSTPLALMITDVDVAAITYTTTGVDGKKVEASGIVAMCVGTQSYENLLSIQHGTLDMEEAPSRVLFNYEIAPVIKKRVVVMADYLGYGASQTPTRQHPYLHIASTGTACADMIEAAREYLRDKGIKENSDKVELMGYSQGGTSTIATLLEMEKRGIASRVIGVHAGGAAYDLIGIMTQFIGAGNMPYPRTGYLPYLIRGMEYGEQMTLNPTKIYASRVQNEGLLTTFETKPLSQWHALLGADITQVINADFYAYPTFNGNVEIGKLLTALEKNSLLSVKTLSTPITIYHSRMDDFVPFSNAEAAHAQWSNSKLVELLLPGHVASGIEFMLKYMGLWELINQK